MRVNRKGQITIPARLRRKQAFDLLRLINPDIAEELERPDSSAGG
ncbi:hypothetical protein [Streptosporangium sp. NPDC000396]